MVMSSDSEQKNILDREELKEINKVTKTVDYKGTQEQDRSKGLSLPRNRVLEGRLGNI